MSQCTCQKCGKTMDEKQFYTYKNGEKTELCKKCLTMHIDNFNPETFLWLLEKMDVPYMEDEWNVLRDRAFAKDPHKMNGMSVFGKYLSKMKLNQFKHLSWEDTATIQKEQEERLKKLKAEQEAAEVELKQKLADGEISEAEYKTLMSTPTQNEELPPPQQQIVIGQDNYYDESNFISEDELIDPAADLTQEDKVYLAMKWGRLYKPSQWVELEKKYTEMMNSFDIQDSDTEGTLILICKTYLKMNEAIDCGDMDGYQKLSRVYDSLRKSAKFTAAQNKEQQGDYVDATGQIVTICEKEGFIARFPTDIPQDKVDVTLKDLEKYTYNLVTQDLGFGQQIEDALKKIQIQKEMEAEEADLEEDEFITLGDSDYADYYEELENQKDLDNEGGNN